MRWSFAETFTPLWLSGPCIESGAMQNTGQGPTVATEITSKSESCNCDKCQTCEIPSIEDQR